MAMATGIVSLAAWQAGRPHMAEILFVLNVFIYALLWGLNIVRVFRFPRRFGADLIDHRRGPGFFTFVAATSILGTQFVILADNGSAGFVLWFVAVGLWICLIYTILTALTVKESKPTLEQGISGAWLLAVVATQSIAVLAAILAARVAQPIRIELNFLALSMWLWGGMLYIWMMSLIFYRYTFFRFSPGDLSPPYWINMGAMAISTLAGARLIANTGDAPFLATLLPFLKGFTVFYWATGTWWIPMLLILGVWRHVYKRFPFVYDPLYWGAVFPLGMYAVSTTSMVDELGFVFLKELPLIFFWVAFAAWLITFAALIIGLLRRFTRGPANA
ncbi:MAG: tellurite resistance/C4-dicarboxylate transporter family protein [Methyloceanibacter sp.]|nr:tellurite resistance/C4-dicarboxylate transporter family protein [Methyloceanibacter sp.]MCC0058181.1 tellurite resistance/C4-dicarboxylate transporter family protein [Hyphomicrobiaceae bacterium]